MRRLILLLRLWWLESDIREARYIQGRLRRDLPAMEAEAHRLRLDLFSIE
jgi:hypothetical protein